MEERMEAKGDGKQVVEVETEPQNADIQKIKGGR